jgi:formylglycine-generating enzyme required for sulfatase activity
VRSNRLVVLIATVCVSGCGAVVDAPPPEAPLSSCDGLPAECGTEAESCCTSLPVEGGAYNRLNDPEWPATVSGFALDKYEVSVGRLRVFASAYPDNLPEPGAGAHPRIDDSGWRDEWRAFLPTTREGLEETFRCTGDPWEEYATWTPEPDDLERAPATCMNWYVAFAFCAWDGGRLPTDAEWNYAAVGGDEQRRYPWGDAPPTDSLVVFNLDGTLRPYEPVGSRPAGAGRWGHLDLNGSRTELTRDAVDSTAPQFLYEHPLPCDDCAVINDALDARVSRDESFLSKMDPPGWPSETPGPIFFAAQVSVAVGIRCARDFD